MASPLTMSLFPRSAPPVRVLVVDDSPLIRREFARLLSRDPEIEVVGSAADAYEARDRIVELRPDVITLDIEMPRMDGLTFLDKLMRYRPLPVVIVSSLTVLGGQRAMDAFDAGATEVVSKPGPGYPVADMEYALVRAVKAAARSARASRAAPREGAPGPARLLTPSGPLRQVIAIGASTGGPQAIESLLGVMPLDGPPMVIVQHMPPIFTRSFAERLARTTQLDVREAASGEALAPGRALIAPGGKHMRVHAGGGSLRVEVAEGARTNLHCPSVDVLFESVAASLGRLAVGVLLTGMGSDGAQGLLAMKRAGAITLAQSEEGCVVFGMPRAAIDLGAADEVVPLGLMPHRALAAAARR